MMHQPWQLDFCCTYKLFGTRTWYRMHGTSDMGVFSNVIFTISYFRCLSHIDLCTNVAEHRPSWTGNLFVTILNKFTIFGAWLWHMFDPHPNLLGSFRIFEGDMTVISFVTIRNEFRIFGAWLWNFFGLIVIASNL